MRFQTIVSLAALGLAGFVSAQNSSAPTQACASCLLNAVKSFPECNTNAWNPSVPNDPTQFTGDEKNCFCSFVSSTDWSSGCVSSSVCPQDVIDEMNQEFATDKSTYCVGFNATPDKSGAMNSKSVMALTTVTLMAAMTTAVMFL